MGDLLPGPPVCFFYAHAGPFWARKMEKVGEKWALVVKRLRLRRVCKSFSHRGRMAMANDPGMCERMIGVFPRPRENWNDGLFRIWKKVKKKYPPSYVWTKRPSPFVSFKPKKEGHSRKTREDEASREKQPRASANRLLATGPARKHTPRFAINKSSGLLPIGSSLRVHDSRKRSWMANKVSEFTASALRDFAATGLLGKLKKRKDRKRKLKLLLLQTVPF